MKTSKYSSWDNSKTVEYTETAERMLRKFNPYSLDNKVPCADYRPSMAHEYWEDDDENCWNDTTDSQYDNYQYKLWIEQQQQENDYE